MNFSKHVQSSVPSKRSSVCSRRDISNMVLAIKILILLLSFAMLESQAKGTSTSKSVNPISPLDKLHWLIGHWKPANDGKVFWPTIPKMTYIEELWIFEAPVAKVTGIRLLNFSATAWSPSVKDHMHNEFGFMTVDRNGNVTLMTTADNGFSTFEEGWIEPNMLTLRLKKIGRISFSRDLPVEDLERKFILLDATHMEQTLAMRTSTHPRTGILDHAHTIYQKA